MCKEIRELFPHIMKKGLQIKLYHYDELAGKILIESNGDMEEALKIFTDEWKSDKRRKYMTLHALSHVR